MNNLILLPVHSSLMMLKTKINTIDSFPPCDSCEVKKKDAKIAAYKQFQYEIEATLNAISKCEKESKTPIKRLIKNERY